MPSDLLIEIGVEELPASFLEGALVAMPDLARSMLSAARLTHGHITALGSPRRLALTVESVADAQTDRADTITGPPASTAFDAAGKPTGAALGFAKKNGVSADAIQTVDTPKGKYIQVQVFEKGKPARDVLAPLVGELCAKVPFKKSMRWGPGEIAFGRPVHWLVALLGGEVLPAEFAGIRAGRSTHGHRFLSPGSIDVPDASAYVARLGDAKVLVDPAARRARMIEALEAEAKRIGGKVVPDEFLVDECMALVELPHAIAGAFNPEFLNLPESVVIAVMRNHQRYFAVRNAAGALMPAYLNVVNTANAPQVIAQGNDRVLRARLKDAQFFVGEDRKVRLEDRVPNLDRVVYQAKLGTVGARVRRLAALVQALGAGEEAKLAAEAATLAKADLVSYIVGEFPELQGEMGRFYALEQGVAPRVADAIRDHYLPKGAGDAVPTDAVGALVAVADRADALVGCFGIGLVPTGSADPFALRRAAIGLARIALEGPLDVDVKQTFGAAYDQFDGVALRPKDDVLAQLDEFVRARLRAFYGEAFPGDLVEACLGAWDGASLRDLDARIRAVAKFREMPAYASLSVAFKRAFNIAKDAPVGEADPKLFADDAEKMLGERFAGVRSVIETAVAAGDYESALVAVANELREPIDKFFETVFVMVDDEKVRENRLRLLGTIARTLTSIARFDQLSA